MKNIILLVILSVCSHLSSAQIHVSDYDVKFDGTGLETNHIGFQNAIDDAHKLGKSVFIAPGKIKLSGSLSVPKDMVINGSGIASTTIIFLGTSGSVFKGENGFSIHHLEISNTKYREKSRAIQCNGGKLNASFLQISHNWDVGIECSNCTTVNIQACKVLGRPDNESGIKFNGTSSEIKITDTFVQNFVNGILINGEANGVLIKTAAVTNSQYGIKFDPSTYSKDIIIEGADITGTDISALLLHQVQNVLVKSVYFVTRKWEDRNADMATISISGDYTKNIRVLSNSIGNHSPKGIKKYKPGVKIEDGNDILIQSLVVRENTVPGVYVCTEAKNVVLDGIAASDRTMKTAELNTLGVYLSSSNVFYNGENLQNIRNKFILEDSKNTKLVRFTKKTAP